MYIAIFIFILITILLALNVSINIKSANDTIKIDAKIGFISFVIPHQRLILKAQKMARDKSVIELRNDFNSLFKNRHYLNRLFKHSCLSTLYVARFTKKELYLNPILNSVYLIFANQVKAYCKNNFKLVDYSNIKLIYDEKYENVDYYLSFKSDIISILTAIFI